ncbi:MAG: hypothetical protein MJ126_05765 [Lachnospiraceae bacterium]|nr:hypothetical protein [Lachnospiraceae bacterium]
MKYYIDYDDINLIIALSNICNFYHITFEVVNNDDGYVVTMSKINEIIHDLLKANDYI